MLEFQIPPSTDIKWCLPQNQEDVDGIWFKIIFVIYLFYLFAVVGPIAFFTYDFIGPLGKAIYGVLLSVCICFFIFGILKRRRWYGKLLIVLSGLGWLMLGLVSIVVTE